MKEQRPKMDQAKKGYNGTYRTFSFRIPKDTPEEEVQEMKEYVREVRELYNADVAPDEKIHKDGEVILRAIALGLGLMKKAKTKSRAKRA